MIRAAAALAFSVLLVAGPVSAQQLVRSGTLSCDISGGVGLIIASQKQMTCLFTPGAPAPQEVYLGTITRLGIDLGATVGGQMVWAVYAPTAGGYAALAGNYTGVGAQATTGVGVGANALVGGSDRTVSLQPLSLEGQAGLNVAAGVTSMDLRPIR